MTNKLRAILTASVFTVILAGFFTLNLIVPSPEISQSERRRLAQFPELTLKTLANARFMSKFEDFAADSFTARDTFRRVRAEIVFNALFMSDKSGLYLGESGAGKFQRLNEREYRLSADKLRRVASAHLSELNVFYCVIPDKSYYSDVKYPGFDPDAAASILSRELSDFSRIDITEALDSSSFYNTDLHWDQTRLRPLLASLGAGLGADFSGAYDALAPVTLGEFYGVYPGQLALPMPPDKLTYLIAANSAVTVTTLNAQTAQFEITALYADALFTRGDPYDVFLYGAQPLIILENARANSDKTLYIFRDSFASSLAPLLAESGAYSKIILIDLRYIDSRILDAFIAFEPGSDALFLYSSQVLNNSSILKV
ncbi:MAG: hypothetical protein LBC78_00825 [Oscillospiraceae bacterium]|jgi:hypothetical protein|nr:hypothetical protein [Oscillospiraceae bacterium]